MPRLVTPTNPNPKPDTQVWGGDGAFLHSLGAIDFAGGIVVHVSSGVSGLTVASMIGKRTGYPLIPKAPHSLVLTHIGASLLWVGWFGFNAGSSTAADFIAGQAMLVTQIASAAGVVGWTAVELSCYGRPSSLGMVSGAIAGLVGVTPASGSIGAMGAICVGVVSGAACFNFCTYVKEAVGTYDDSLDVFGIHGVGGVVGALLTAVWCAPDLGGAGFGQIVLRGGEVKPIREIGTQLGVQAVSIAYAVCWSVAATVVAVKFIDVCHGGHHLRLCRLSHVRSTPKEEEAGLDDAYFAESAYNFAPQDMQISVEVGPLRGRKGHGLSLYYTDDEGTRHPIGFSGDAQDPDDPSQRDAMARMNDAARPHALSDAVANALWSGGGTVNIRRERGGDGKVTAEHISVTPGESREGTVRGGEDAA